MRVDVVTIFPDYLAPLRLSLLGKAGVAGLLDLHVHDLRDHTHDRHRTVDDTPYGGGAGMVMRPEPWGEALDAVLAAGPEGRTPHLLVPSPAGRPFTQAMAHELAAEPWLVFACGRYEGIDERVLDDAASRMRVTPVSLGDYVLNGGEVAAMAVIEAVGRLIPGVVGNPHSLVEESHSDGLLEYPSYTKPVEWRGRRVPEVLTSGNHAAIAAWRREQQVQRTAARRPDLLPRAAAASPDEGELRPATLADAGELLTLTRACWVQEAISNETLAIPGIHETFDGIRTSLGEWSTLVLRIGGRLVGSVRGRPHAERAGVWEIGRLMVAPDLQGRGLGRHLLAAGEALAPDGTTTYELFTGARSTDNLRMYKKAGYTKVRAEAPPVAVVLRKHVRGVQPGRQPTDG